MKTFTYLLFLLTTHVVLGQDNLTLTSEQNENWISQVEQVSLDNQLRLIRERILADTGVYVRSSAPDRIRIGDESQNGKKKEATARPLIIFAGKCKHVTPNINNKTDNESILLLTSLLTRDKIQKITILKGPDAAAIYGSRAVGGVFILAVKKKSTCQKIGDIDFGQW
jgi:TonB-dependent SusC/RagA subfamily outer membrane receptor